MRFLRLGMVQAKLLVSFAGIIILVGVLLAVCQAAWHLLFDTGTCRDARNDCLGLPGLGGGSLVWPPLIATAASLLVGLLLTRRITWPLRELTRATRAIAAGRSKGLAMWPNSEQN